MQKAEQMRRRNPKAHTATILTRRETDVRPLKQNAPLHNPTPPVSVNPINSTQQVRWDAPMIATGEMLRLPSTAPDVTLGTESMLDAPLVINHGEGMSTNLDKSESGPSSSTLGPGEGTSVPALKQTQSNLDVPPRHSGTTKFTAHDLQDHIDKSITGVANDQFARQEEALGKEVRELLGEGSLNGSQPHKWQVPKALRIATRREFQAIISEKCSENEYEHVTDSPGLSYARELRDIIVQKAKSEEEYHHLTSRLTHLLEEESTNPKILLKVLSDTLRPHKLDAPTNNVESGQVQLNDTINGQPGPIRGRTKTATGATEHGPGLRETGSGSLNDFNSHDQHKKESIGPSPKLVHPSNGTVNGFQENKGGRKRSGSADDEHPKKKKKPAPAHEKMFVDLLRREAARSTRG